MIKVPKTMVIDFKRMAGLRKALEEKINRENPQKLVPASDATGFIAKLLEEYVKE